MKPLLLLTTSLLAGSVPTFAQSFAVTGVLPAHNAAAVPRAANVAVTFSQPLTAGSAGALRVFSDQRGGRLPGTATISGNTLTFDPSHDFKPGETVRASITTAAQATNGTALAAPRVVQFTTAALGGTGIFGGGTEVSAGPSPYSLATGDLDADGDLDLVVANDPDNALGSTVSIRLNDGVGGFAPPAAGAELAVGGRAQRVILGDIDGDGDLDLLTANFYSNTVSVRLNNGLGTMTAPATGAEVPISVAASLELADIDADGDLDLLALNGIYSISANATVSIRLNNGSGQFSAPPANALVEAGNGPYSLNTGDLDNDGDLDLLVPNDGASRGGGTVSIRLNDGRGSFTRPAVGAEVPLFQGVDAAAVGDIDGDGDLDLLAVNYGGPTSVGTTVSVRLNNGSGVFLVPAVGAEIVVDNGPRSLTLGDIDGDGDLDLLVANVGVGQRTAPGTTVSVRLNDGLHSGNFVTPANGSGTVVVGTRPYALAMADIDNDGDLDLLTANTASNTVSVRLNNGRGLPLATLAAHRAAAPLRLYPNPAQRAAHAQVPRGTREVTLLNALGQTLRTVAVAPAATDVALPLAGLPAGVYVVRAGAAIGRLVVE